MTEQRVRDLVNHPRRATALRADTPRWNMVCSALDTIGDAQLAIREYLDGKLSAPTHGITYLAIYGVLQTLYVQQDALRDLGRAVGIELELPDDLKAIRDIRNAAAGHPTNHRKRFSNTINRNAMSAAGFELARYAPDGSASMEWIDLTRLARKQDELVETLLDDVAARLEDEERSHRAEWRGKPLAPPMREGALYAFEKISAGFRGDHMGPWGLASITDRITRFRDALQQRGLSGGLIGVECALEELEHPLRQLMEHFSGKGRMLSAEDGAVFTYYLRGKFEELCEMAEEIDREYESDSIV